MRFFGEHYDIDKIIGGIEKNNEAIQHFSEDYQVSEKFLIEHGIDPLEHVELPKEWN